MTLIFSPEVGSGEAFKLLFAFGHKPTLKRVPNPGLLLKIKMKKSKPTAGYRLHVKRLLFASNTGTTRTFKYPLVKTCKKHGKQKATNFLDVPHDLIEAIKHDDLYIRGPSNLVDYIKYKDAKIYTLIDFWLDSLRAGVVFWPDNKSMQMDLMQINDFNLYEKFLHNAPMILRIFEPATFVKEILFLDIRGGNKKSKLREKLEKSVKNNINNNRELALQAKELINKISGALIKGQNLLAPKDRKVYWLSEWNIDIDKIKNFFNLNITAIPHPDVTSFMENELTPENIISIINSIIISHIEFAFRYPNLLPTTLKNIFEKIKIENKEFFTKDLKIKVSLNEILLKIKSLATNKTNKRGNSEEKSSRKIIEDLTDKYLKKTFGLSKKAAGLSNYLNKFLRYLKQQKTKKLLDYYKDKLGFNQKSQLKTIELRLIWLSKRADKFLSAADKPKVFGVKGWHDYRQIINGKIASWLTNHIKRLSEQTEQLKNLIKSFNKIVEFINKYPKEEQKYNMQSNPAHKENILKLIKQIRELAKNVSQVQENIKQYKDVASLVKALRQELNEYSQLYYRNQEGQKVKPSEISYLKDFWDLRIYKPRSFYGYAQREKLEKIARSTIPTIKSGINLVQGLLKQLQNLPNYANAEKETDKNSIRKSAGFRRLLEALARKIRDHKINTKPFRDKYLQILQNYANSYELKNLNKYVFFKSNYSTSTQHEIELKNINYADEAKSVVTNLIEFLSSFTQKDLLKDPQLLLDWVETAKLVIARMFKWMDQQKEWDLNNFNLEVFQATKDFIKSLKSNDVKTRMFRYVIINLMFSELRGASIMFSRKLIKTKWNISFVDSLSKYKLMAISQKDNNKIQLSQNLPQRLKWYVIIPKKLAKSIKKLEQPLLYFTKISTKKIKGENIVYERFIKLGKDKLGYRIIQVPNIINNMTLQICTSKYQLQFLERLVYQPKNWQNIIIHISNPSLIVEETHEISWEHNKNKITLSKIQTTNSPILYYALPLQLIVNRPNKKNTPLEAIKKRLHKIKTISNDNKRQKAWYELNNDILYYLGADIGEYGIAWVITKINEKNNIISVEEYGFEFDNQIRKIQDKFNEIQQKARKGVFLEASTELAKLRENAIGYLRNKLHDKLIKYKGHIIYEANISGFESGVGRTTKIYDSVKRADIGNHPDVTKDIGKQLANHIWGLKKGNKENSPGWQVSATGTSYTCINCGQTIYGLGREKDNWERTGTIAGNIHKFKHPIQNITILGYKENFKGQQVDYKTLRKIAKNFARPPLVSIDKNTGKLKPSAVSEQFIINKDVLTEKQLEVVKKKRGNSAIFVCPFEGCHAVTDADIQAALVIAIRGYLYMKEYYVNKKDKPFSNDNDKTVDEKQRLRDLTIQLLKNSVLKGKLGFIYYKGNNN